MNSVTITGKVTSRPRIDTVKLKDNTVVDVHSFGILGQTQGDPTQEVQIVCKSYEPAVTRMIQAAKLGDMYAITGSLVTKFETYEDENHEKRRKPVYYYVYATQAEKLIK